MGCCPWGRTESDTTEQLSSSRASQMAQWVKNLLAIQETLVQPLGWEDLLDEGMAAHFGILA